MIKLLLSITVVLMILTGCQDESEVLPSPTLLVVEAMITSDPVPQTILITHSAGINTDSITCVRNALVIITESNGTEHVFREVETTYGTIYQCSEWPGLREEEEYRLSIKLSESLGGHDFFEATSRVCPLEPVDSIKLKYHGNWGIAGAYEVQCYYRDPPTREYYMCNLLVNNNLVTNTLSEKFVVDDLLFNGNYADGIICGILDQSECGEKLHQGDYVYLQLASVDESFARFMRGVQSETGLENPFYGSPAANVYSNISNGAVGYFTCCKVTYSGIRF